MMGEYMTDKKNKPQIKKLLGEIRKDDERGGQLLNKHFDFADWLDQKLN